MPDTNTAHYSWVKPEIGASVATWGNKLNADLDAIDTQVFVLQTSDADKLSLTTGGVLTGQVSTTIPPTHPNDIATKAYVDAAIVAAINTAIPVGLIALWSGSGVSIPSNWAPCDGNTYNGHTTPNTNNRFVRGAGGQNPFTVGGQDNHNHTGADGLVALTVGQIPGHTHPVSDPGHLHIVTIHDPGHLHNVSAPVSTNTVNGGAAFGAAAASTGTTTSAAATGITATDGAAATGVTVLTNGGGGTHNHTITLDSNIPVYIALFYIMKVS